MAIGPEDVAESMQDEETIRRHERKIDTYLKSRFKIGDSHPFYDISRMNEATVKAIIYRYQKAGWNVERGSDRDGPHLIFRKP